MNKRKVITIVSFVCIMIAIFLCIILFQSNTFNPGRIYYNDNLLYKEFDTYHCINWKTNKIQEENMIEFSIGRFSGVRSVQKFEVTIDNGNFKIVLVDITNSNVEILCEDSGNGSFSNLSLPSGEYCIKFVGDNAAVNGKFILF